ncbi:MAG: hypothetical protein R2774_12740 [Saprospiraceae bacterium]
MPSTKARATATSGMVLIATSGTYTHTEQSIFGCDSITTLQLAIHPSYDNTIQHQACDSYVWNGITYTDSGVYTHRAQTTAGCDSITTLELTIQNTLTSSEQKTECTSFTWNGSTYDQSGTYTYQTTSVNGCDSIATPCANYPTKIRHCHQLAHATATSGMVLTATSGTYSSPVKSSTTIDFMSITKEPATNLPSFTERLPSLTLILPLCFPVGFEPSQLIFDISGDAA